MAALICSSAAGFVAAQPKHHANKHNAIIKTIGFIFFPLRKFRRVGVAAPYDPMGLMVRILRAIRNRPYIPLEGRLNKYFQRVKGACALAAGGRIHRIPRVTGHAPARAYSSRRISGISVFLSWRNFR